jgi:hypothetical protein
MAWRPGRASSGLLLAGVGSWAAACGLARSGLEPDGAGGDAGADATSLGDGNGSYDAPRGDGGQEAAPPACKTLDAACVGPIPAGWQPVGVSDAGCPAEFDAHTLLVNPRVGNGGCGCGACQVVGAYGCGSVSVSGGNTCMDPTLVVAPPGVCTPASAQHVEGYPPAVTGTVGCVAPNDAGTGATTDPLTVCVPGCAADYCGLPSPCIMADGDKACPAGFTRHLRAGTGVDPGCAPCACEAGAPGPCTGTVTVFDNATCDDSGSSATYGIGTCNQFSTQNNYAAVLAQVVPPLVGCNPAFETGDVGDASLTGVKSICCR